MYYEGKSLSNATSCDIICPVTYLTLIQNKPVKPTHAPKRLLQPFSQRYALVSCIEKGISDFLRYYGSIGVDGGALR